VADAEAFAEFVAARSPALLRSAYLLVGDQATAEDLLQHALTRVFLRWDKLEEPAAAEAYVRTTLVRSLISWRRRRWYHAEIPQAVTPDVSTSDLASQVVTQQALMPHLMSLSPRQRVVLVLRYFMDMTEAEVAHELGCSVGAVKSHAARGRRALRESLHDDTLERSP
jgi:RNA polymerase sigma-70 factor, ECF subfamily